MYCHFADLCKMEGTVAEFATVASDMSTIFATSREWLFFMGYLTIATCCNLRETQIALLFSHFSEARKMGSKRKRTLMN